MKLPDFFVIGAQKAGSTWLLKCLGEHPDIFMPPEEIAFFEDDLYDAARIGNFASHFAAAKPGQLVGVKRPNLLGHPECIERLHRHMPELKLVVVLRDPIERAVSAYFHYMGTGLLPIVPIEQGLPRILDGECDRYPRAGEIVEFSLYHRHLQDYAARFGRERIFVSLLDDIKRDAHGELRRLYVWLGVHDDFLPTTIDERPMQAAYSLTRLRLRESIARPCRTWTSDGKYFRVARDPLRKWIYGVNVAVDRLLWSRLFRARPPQLPAELRQRLADRFSTEIAGLETWLDRDLSKWKR